MRKAPERYGGEIDEHFRMRIDVFLKDAENEQIILRNYFLACFVGAMIFHVIAKLVEIFGS